MIIWNFCKEILFFIVSFCLYVYFIDIFKKVFYLDSEYLTLDYRLYYLKRIQYFSVLAGLDNMHYNEYCFYRHSNIEAFIQSKMEYQEGLKILSDTLNFHEFLCKEDELKIFTAFYEHYFKIIELNNNLIKNKKL